MTAPQKLPAVASDTTCPRCGSDKILRDVMLSVASGTGLVLRLSDGTRAKVNAFLCGSCGDVRLQAEGAQRAWEALRGGR